MSHQPTAHRREIWSSLCIGYDTVSGLLWQQARDAHAASATAPARARPASTPGPRRSRSAGGCWGQGEHVEDLFGNPVGG